MQPKTMDYIQQLQSLDQEAINNLNFQAASLHMAFIRYLSPPIRAQHQYYIDLISARFVILQEQRRAKLRATTSPLIEDVNKTLIETNNLKRRMQLIVQPKVVKSKAPIIQKLNSLLTCFTSLWTSMPQQHQERQLKQNSDRQDCQFQEQQKPLEIEKYKKSE